MTWFSARRRRRDASILEIVALSTVLALPGSPALARDVIVVAAGLSNKVSKDAVRGFREVVHANGHMITAQYDLNEDRIRIREALSTIESKPHPELVLTVGNSALEHVVQHHPTIQTVYTLVHDPPNILGAELHRVTGASTNIDVAELFRSFRKLAPEIHRIGFLFKRDTSGYLLKRAASIAADHGFQLIGQDFRGANEIGRALKVLLGSRIEALWLSRDLGRRDAKDLIDRATRRGIPVLGHLCEHAKYGAVLVLHMTSGEQVGRQAGALANRIMSNHDARPLRYSEIADGLVVQRKVAQNLGLTVPSDWRGKDHCTLPYGE